jgi:epsilon-lactone hydrolase
LRGLTMRSLRSLLVRQFIKRSMRPVTDLSKHAPEAIRAKFAAMIPAVKGAVVESTTAGGLHAEWVSAAKATPDPRQVILHCHGGGFFMGSCATHRGLALRLSAASGCRVLLFDYRLAPEHKHPAAHDDVLAVYRWLLGRGVSADDIIFGGDSAGASLALMALLALRDAHEPLPRAAYLLSAWDPTCFDAESYTSRAAADPMNDRASFEKSAALYFDVGAPRPPSLLAQPLAGLPPLLIQVGGDEVILSDSERLAERAKAAGVDVTLEVWEHLWHVFQSFAPIVPEATAAVKRIGAFVRAYRPAAEPRPASVASTATNVT